MTHTHTSNRVAAAAVVRNSCVGRLEHTTHATSRRITRVPNGAAAAGYTSTEQPHRKRVSISQYVKFKPRTKTSSTRCCLGKIYAGTDIFVRLPHRNPTPPTTRITETHAPDGAAANIVDADVRSIYQVRHASSI